MFTSTSRALGRHGKRRLPCAAPLTSSGLCNDIIKAFLSSGTAITDVKDPQDQLSSLLRRRDIVDAGMEPSSSESRRVLKMTQVEMANVQSEMVLRGTLGAGSLGKTVKRRDAALRNEREKFRRKLELLLKDRNIQECLRHVNESIDFLSEDDLSQVCSMLVEKGREAEALQLTELYQRTMRRGVIENTTDRLRVSGQQQEVLLESFTQEYGLPPATNTGEIEGGSQEESQSRPSFDTQDNFKSLLDSEMKRNMEAKVEKRSLLKDNLVSIIACRDWAQLKALLESVPLEMLQALPSLIRLKGDTFPEKDSDALPPIPSDLAEALDSGRWRDVLTKIREIVSQQQLSEQLAPRQISLVKQWGAALKDICEKAWKNHTPKTTLLRLLAKGRFDLVHSMLKQMSPEEVHALSAVSRGAVEDQVENVRLFKEIYLGNSDVLPQGRHLLDLVKAVKELVREAQQGRWIYVKQLLECLPPQFYELDLQNLELNETSNIEPLVPQIETQQIETQGVEGSSDVAERNNMVDTSAGDNFEDEPDDVGEKDPVVFGLKRSIKELVLEQYDISVADCLDIGQHLTDLDIAVKEKKWQKLFHMLCVLSQDAVLAITSAACGVPRQCLAPADEIPPSYEYVEEAASEGRWDIVHRTLAELGVRRPVDNEQDEVDFILFWSNRLKADLTAGVTAIAEPAHKDLQDGFRDLLYRGEFREIRRLLNILSDVQLESLTSLEWPDKKNGSSDIAYEKRPRFSTPEAFSNYMISVANIDRWDIARKHIRLYPNYFLDAASTTARSRHSLTNRTDALIEDGSPQIEETIEEEVAGVQLEPQDDAHTHQKTFETFMSDLNTVVPESDAHAQSNSFRGIRRLSRRGESPEDIDSPVYDQNFTRNYNRLSGNRTSSVNKLLGRRSDKSINIEYVNGVSAASDASMAVTNIMKSRTYRKGFEMNSYKAGLETSMYEDESVVNGSTEPSPLHNLSVLLQRQEYDRLLAEAKTPEVLSLARSNTQVRRQLCDYVIAATAGLKRWQDALNLLAKAERSGVGVSLTCLSELTKLASSAADANISAELCAHIVAATMANSAKRLWACPEAGVMDLAQLRGKHNELALASVRCVLHDMWLVNDGRPQPERRVHDPHIDLLIAISTDQAMDGIALLSSVKQMIKTSFPKVEAEVVRNAPQNGKGEIKATSGITLSIHSRGLLKWLNLSTDDDTLVADTEMDEENNVWAGEKSMSPSF